MRANQEIMKGYLKLNGIFFVRAFPFYFDLHLKLHCDKKVNADPSILASPCPCKKKNKPKHTMFFCRCSHGILRAGKDNFGASNSGKFYSLHQSNYLSPLFPLWRLVCPGHKSWEGSRVRISGESEEEAVLRLVNFIQAVTET